MSDQYIKRILFVSNENKVNLTNSISLKEINGSSGNILNGSVGIFDIKEVQSEENEVNETKMSENKIMTLDEVAQLAENKNNCILVINNRVYNVTNFLDEVRY